MIINPAVSNGQARPTGLNGSCRLSAPAATFAPACCSASIGGQPARHRRACRDPAGTGSCGGVRRRSRPAAATSSAIALRLDVGAGRGSRSGWRWPGGRTRRAPHDTSRRARRPSDRASRRCADRRRRRSRWRCRAGRRSASRPRSLVEVRAATDEVGAGGHRLAQQRPLVGAADAGHRPAAQRDDLDRRSGRRSRSRTADERLDAAQAVLQGDVDVGTDRDVAVVRHQPGRPLGPLGDVGDASSGDGSPPSPRWHPSDRPSGWRSARPGTPCRGGRAARPRPAASSRPSRSITSTPVRGATCRSSPIARDRAVDHVHIGEHILAAVEPGVHVQERRRHVRETTSMS